MVRLLRFLGLLAFLVLAAAGGFALGGALGGVLPAGLTPVDATVDALLAGVARLRA